MNRVIILVAVLLAFVAATIPSDSAPASQSSSRTTELSGVGRQLAGPGLNLVLLVTTLMTLGAVGVFVYLGVADAFAFPQDAATTAAPTTTTIAPTPVAGGGAVFVTLPPNMG